MSYDTWKFHDYRSDEAECPIHGTFYTSEICPDCDAEDSHREMRKRRAKKIRAARERKRMARIYQGFLNHESQIMRVVDALKVSFASPDFMRSEVEWLKEGN